MVGREIAPTSQVLQVVFSRLFREPMLSESMSFRSTWGIYEMSSSSLCSSCLIRSHICRYALWDRITVKVGSTTKVRACVNSRASALRVKVVRARRYEQRIRYLTVNTNCQSAGLLIPHVVILGDAGCIANEGPIRDPHDVVLHGQALCRPALPAVDSH